MLLFFYSKISCHVKDTYYLGVVSQICHRIHVRIRTVWVLNYYNINLVFKFFFTFLTGSIQLIQNKQVFLSLHQIHTNYQVKTICYCFDMFCCKGVFMAYFPKKHEFLLKTFESKFKTQKDYFIRSDYIPVHE